MPYLYTEGSKATATNQLLKYRKKFITTNPNNQQLNGLDQTFVIFYQNVRGLNTKTVDFYNNVCLTENEYDMVAVSETWLSNSVYDNELFPENVLVFKNRNRKDSSQGGGVLVAVKKNYKCTLLNLDYTSPDIDALAVKIYTSDIGYIYILNIYITPTCSALVRDDFFSYIENLECLYQSRFIFLGDFNITHLNDYYVSGYRDQYVDILLNFVHFLDCNQCNRVLNDNNRILDLVITKGDCEVYKSTYGLVSVDPHHPPLTVEIGLSNPKQKYLMNNNNTINYNFKKADFHAMYQLFQNVCWNGLRLFSKIDLEEMKNIFFMTR